MHNLNLERLYFSSLTVALATALVPAAACWAAEQPDPTTLDTIQVRAAEMEYLKSEQGLTPGGVSVVDGETFYERPVANLADSLRFVPGVWSESAAGGDAVFISSRGSNLDATDYDSNGIKLFQDGLPVTTADGNNHNRFIDPLAARYLVIARGANALTYGASTLGGAIDFVSPTARSSSLPQLFLSGGSFGALSARLSVGGVSGGFDGQATVEGVGRDGYREHSEQRRAGLYANVGWQLSDHFDLRLFATHVDNHEELSGALSRAQVDEDPRQANPSAITGNFQLNVKTDRLAAKGIWEIDAASRLEFGLSYEEQNLYHPIVDKVMVDFDGAGPNPPVEVFSLLKNTDQRTVAGMVRYNLIAGDHDVLAGINLADTSEDGGNYRNDRGRRNGQTEIVGNRSNSAEVFLMDRWQVAPDWTVVYGAQGVLTGRDVRSVNLASGEVRNPKDDYSSFNPRLGAIYQISPATQAFASASRLYEAPTTFELQDDVRGDSSTLNAMHGVVYEVGLRGATASSVEEPQWHWDLSVYYAQITDEILSVDDPLAPGTSLSTNIEQTIHGGLEALIGAILPLGSSAHRLEPLISATYNRFSFDNDAVYGDNDLPAAPNYAVRAEVMYRNANGFFAGPTFDLTGARYADFSNTYRIASYSLVGLRAGITRGQWELFGEVRNLLDESYVGALSVRNQAHVDDAILQPGAPRSLVVGMRFQF